MPELPEMETYRRLLTERIKGSTVSNVVINRDKSINCSEEIFIQEVKNQQITAIERRAKHLIFHLGTGKVLLLHLMLGGWMFYGTEDEAPDRTKQVILSFGATHLYFIGLRLGYLHLLTKEELSKEFDDLGPEPLDANFGLQQFLSTFEGKKGRIKTTLVDQNIISGIGNCYSDEICFEAMVLPNRRFNELSDPDLKQLFQATKSVLQNAITGGGYIETPFFKNDKLTGAYNKDLKVYDRESEQCKRCGETIVKTEISSRKSFHCPNCQK